jgi:hypothetical protein
VCVEQQPHSAHVRIIQRRVIMLLLPLLLPLLLLLLLVGDVCLLLVGTRVPRYTGVMVIIIRCSSMLRLSRRRLVVVLRASGR